MNLSGRKILYFRTLLKMAHAHPYCLRVYVTGCQARPPLESLFLRELATKEIQTQFAKVYGQPAHFLSEYGFKPSLLHIWHQNLFVSSKLLFNPNLVTFSSTFTKKVPIKIHIIWIEKQNPSIEPLFTIKEIEVVLLAVM